VGKKGNLSSTVGYSLMTAWRKTYFWTFKRHTDGWQSGAVECGHFA